MKLKFSHNLSDKNFFKFELKECKLEMKAHITREFFGILYHI